MALYELPCWSRSMLYLSRWARNGCHISKNVLRLSLMPYQTFSICNTPMSSLNQVLNWGTVYDFQSFKIIFFAITIPYIIVLCTETQCLSREGETPNNAIIGSGSNTQLYMSENHLMMLHQKLYSFGQVQKRWVREPSADLHRSHRDEMVGKILCSSVFE